jgi:hypothetical protein
MPSSDLISIAQQFHGLPMDSLIGGPLNAAARANAAMAVTQTKFLLDTCFKKTTTSGATSYDPIMIKMTLTRGVIQPQPSGPPLVVPIVTNIDLPLLTIVPLNSLGVDNVNVTFEMEVKSSFSEEQSDQQETDIKASAEFEMKIGWGPISATVRGSASYDHKDSSTHNTHYEKSNSAKYSVSVHAGQLPLPKGVNTIIEAYAQTIQPLTMPTQQGGGTTTTTTPGAVTTTTTTP